MLAKLSFSLNDEVIIVILYEKGDFDYDGGTSSIYKTENAISVG